MHHKDIRAGIGKQLKRNSAGNEPHMGKFSDILMLIMQGGLMNTEVEFQSLLEANGFELTNIIETQSPLSIIEAVPVKQILAKVIQFSSALQ